MKRVIDEVIVANSDAIRRIEKEIKMITTAKSVVEIVKDTSEGGEVVRNRKTQKCRYYNRGYCKYTEKCRFIHPKNSICGEYLKNQKCDKEECCERHPKTCKWDGTRVGVKENQGYKFVGCKHNVL